MLNSFEKYYLINNFKFLFFSIHYLKIKSELKSYF